MKLFTVFSALLASSSALAAYVPHGHTSVGLSQGSVELVNGDSALQARAEEKSDSNDSQGLSNPLDAFFNELKHAATEENDPTGTVEKRSALGSVLGNVVDMVGPDAPDFNQIVRHGFNVTATYVASVDLNALASDSIEWASEKITSNSNIPGTSIIVSCLTGVKNLVAKVNLNTQAQSYLAIIGRFVTSIDFNSAIAKAIEFCKSVYSSMQSA